MDGEIGGLTVYIGSAPLPALMGSFGANVGLHLERLGGHWELVSTQGSLHGVWVILGSCGFLSAFPLWLGGITLL